MRNRMKMHLYQRQVKYMCKCHLTVLVSILRTQIYQCHLIAAFLPVHVAVVMFWQMLCFDLQNEGIPESDEGPTVEVAQPLSREGTPTGEQRLIDNEGKEEPDASATPPPPPESQSPEPEMDQEQMDTYIESGNDAKKERFIIL